MARASVPRMDASDRLRAPMKKVVPASVLLLLLAGALTACGPSAPRGIASALDARTVDDESYDDVRRLYLVLAPDDPQRETVRGRLIGFLSSRTDALLAQEDYDGVVEQLGEMTSLLVPGDLAEGRALPREIAPVAHWIAERGSRRGDEPRVLARCSSCRTSRPAIPRIARSTSACRGGGARRDGERRRTCRPRSSTPRRS